MYFIAKEAILIRTIVVYVYFFMTTMCVCFLPKCQYIFVKVSTYNYIFVACVYSLTIVEHIHILIGDCGICILVLYDVCLPQLYCKLLVSGISRYNILMVLETLLAIVGYHSGDNIFSPFGQTLIIPQPRK